jgi:hypothetical protein
MNLLVKDQFCNLIKWRKRNQSFAGIMEKDT